MMQQYIVFIRILWIILHFSLTNGYADRSLEQQQSNGNVDGPNVFVALSFQDIFVDDCESHLLSNNNLEDGVISQAEYGDFLEFVCVEQGGCVDGFSYDTVNDKLKSLFLNVACPESAQYNETYCLQEYEELGSEYGILADWDSLAEISNRILWLCMSSFQIIRQEGLFDDRSSFNVSNDATHSQAPTEGIPSIEPTASPTLQGTTLSPTQQVTNTTQSPDGVVPSSNNNDQSHRQLGLGAMIMLICVGVVILFCLAAVIAGRSKHPNYDINQPPLLTTAHPKDISLRWDPSATEDES